MSAATYTAKDITVLEGLEPVRKRPSMYIGGVDAKGLHHLVWEIVDNAVDEYLNGHADAITVTLHKNGDAVTVTDNGRGIPVDMHPKHKRPALELILTTLHSGAKFGDGETTSTPAVCTASARRSSTPCRASWSPPSAATASSGSRPSGAASRPASWKSSAPSAATARPSTSSRTPTSSRPRSSIPSGSREHLEDMSYIHSGLKITFKDEIAKETYDLTHPGGIPEFLQRLVTEGQKPAGDGDAVHARPQQRREDGGRLAVDRVDRRGDPLLRQRHPHLGGRHARSRLQEAASPRPSATTWRRTRSRPRA